MSHNFRNHKCIVCGTSQEAAEHFGWPCKPPLEKKPQNHQTLEHFVRQPDNRWLLSETNRLEDTIHLSSIDCDLALAEVYDKVELSA